MHRSLSIKAVAAIGRKRHLMLFLFAVLLAITRLRTLTEPPETDLAVYSVIGRELVAGRKLYSDLWDIKPPAIYWLYACAAAFTTRGPWMRYWLWIVASVATMVGVYRLAQILTHSRTAGIWAAFAWTVLSQHLELQANQPNTEVFLNAVVVWAMVVLLLPQTHSSPSTFLRSRLTAGVLFGVGLLLKPVIAPWVGTSILIEATHPRNRFLVSPVAANRLRWSWLQTILVFSAGVALPIAAAITVLYFQNSLSEFLEVMFRWNRWYAQNPLQNIFEAYLPVNLLPVEMRDLIPWVLAAAVACSVLMAKRRSHSIWHIVCIVALLPSVIGLPGRWYPHYYQLWLPWLAILLPVAGVGLRRSLSKEVGAIWVGALIVVTIWRACTLGADLLHSPVEWSLRKYGPCFVNEETLGKRIARILTPTETFFVWGNTPTLYGASSKRPPTGVFFVIPLLYGPTTETLSLRTLHQLERTHPELLVINMLDNPAPASHPVVQWFNNNYAPHPLLESGDPKFRLYCRKGGALSTRLQQSLRPSFSLSTEVTRR